MRIRLSIILMLLSSFFLKSQDIAWSINIAENSNLSNFVLEKGEILYDTTEKKRIVVLEGENAWITTKNKVDNPGTIIVSHYLSLTASDFDVLIEYSKDELTWSPFSKSKPKIEFSDLTGKKSKIKTEKLFTSNLIGSFYIRLRIDNYTSGLFSILDLLIEETSPEAIDKQLAIAKLVDERKVLVENLINGISYSAAKLTGETLVDQYTSQTDKYVELLSTLEKLEIVYDISIFMYNRSQMASTSQYKEDFNRLLTDLKDKSSLVDQQIMEDLEQSLEKPLLKPNKPDHKVSAFLKIGYNIGNALSGGKLAGVINSIKSIFGRTYATSNLVFNELQTAPGKKEIFQFRGKKDGVVFIGEEEYKKIQLIIQNGLDDLNDFSDLFEIIDNENAELAEMIELLEKNSREINEFVEDLHLEIKHFYGQFEIEITTEGITEKMALADNDFTGNLTAQIVTYFDTLIIGLDTTSFVMNRNSIEGKLADLAKELEGFEETKEEYFYHAEQLYNMTQAFSDGLKQGNPFEEHKEKFSTSYEKWNTLRSTTEESVEGLPAKIQRGFIVYMRNRLGR